MPRKKKIKYESWFDTLIDLLIGLGFFYLLYKLIHTDEEIDEIPGQLGIHGPPRLNKFIALKLGDKEPYFDDIKQLDPEYQKAAFRVVTQAQYAESLNGNWIKPFTNDIIKGELIKGKVRIFYYRHSKGLYYTVHVFLKKSNETDEKNKIIARNRINRLLSNS